MYKYPVIIFEGIEASGKSTNIKIVANYLKKIKRKFIKIREPGGTKNSEKIRKLILNKNSNFDVNTDLLLYLAARSENIKLIKKFYKKKIILIDRFTDSTIAYQHYGMGLDKKIIILLNKYILKDIKPNFTFLNIVSMKNLKLRLERRLNKNRYDGFNMNFYKKVQNGYIILSKNKKNYMIVNSNNSIIENKKIILKKINALLYK